MLSERQRLILSAIVDDYIRSAEPVGSRSISKRGDIGFSAATIRNEMSDLEELGFLEQPHTSAGRIPSHKGYRYYVDHLVKYGSLSPHELEMTKMFFADKLNEMEDVIQQVAMVLSNLTNYTSIVLGPEVFNTTLKSLQIVPLDLNTAVAIIVTSTGHVENRTFSIPEGIPLSSMEKMTNILNHKLLNVPLYELNDKLYREIVLELKKNVSEYQQLFGVIDSVLSRDRKNFDRIFLSGTTNMLVQPEFKDLEKVKNILDFLDEAETVMDMFSTIPEGIQVRIGTENNIEDLSNCSLITATYSMDGTSLGTIGILGPTRMEYSKVLGLVDYLSKNLNVILKRWYK